jgi:hypothetical protein
MRLLIAFLLGLVIFCAAAPQAAANTFEAGPAAKACGVHLPEGDCAAPLDVEKLAFTAASGKRGAAITRSDDCGPGAGRPSVTLMALQFASGQRGMPGAPTRTLWARRGDGSAFAEEAPGRRRFFFA